MYDQVFVMIKGLGTTNYDSLFMSIMIICSRWHLMFNDIQAFT